MPLASAKTATIQNPNEARQGARFTQIGWRSARRNTGPGDEPRPRLSRIAVPTTGPSRAQEDVTQSSDGKRNNNKRKLQRPRWPGYPERPGGNLPVSNLLTKASPCQPGYFHGYPRELTWTLRRDREKCPLTAQSTGVRLLLRQPGIRPNRTTAAHRANVCRQQHMPPHGVRSWIRGCRRLLILDS